MALLPDAARAGLVRQFCDDNRDPIAAIKPEIRNAVNALDDWFDSTAATINAAIPTAPRNKLTAAQKSRLLAAIVLRRFQDNA